MSKPSFWVVATCAAVMVVSVPSSGVAQVDTSLPQPAAQLTLPAPQLQPVPPLPAPSLPEPVAPVLQPAISAPEPSAPASQGPAAPQLPAAPAVPQLLVPVPDIAPGTSDLAPASSVFDSTVPDLGFSLPELPLSEFDFLPVLPLEAEPAPEAASEPAPTQLSPARVPSAGATILEAGEFGYLEQRPSERPYGWIAAADLSESQREAVQRWARSPYVLVWVYDVHPNATNNWAGWGPPPPGWVTRPQFGELTGDGLPWPPPGIPPAR